MLPYEFINKEWIVSRTARRVYRTSAVISLFLIPLLVADIMHGPLPFIRQLVFIGVVATAINGVGMEYFLFRFDQSTGLAQIVWFCVMLVPPLGPALFCFVVYSRSEALKAVGA